jgi:hypothetical protein
LDESHPSQSWLSERPQSLDRKFFLAHEPIRSRFSL